MPGQLLLEVVTPSRLVLSAPAEIVVLPGVDGEFAVLPNHAPIVAGLTIGILRYGPLQGERSRMFVSGGVAEIDNNRITVLAEAAELAEEIDLIRARQAKERAERRLHDHSAHIDFHRAELALRRAITRIKTVERP